MNSTQNIKVLLAGIVIVIVAGLGVLYLTPQKQESFGNFAPVGAGTYLLQSSISSTQTTITLTSFTEPGSGIKYTMAYINTNIVYGTLSPSSGNSEFVSFTGITQNANGTATLTGVTRGQARTPGNTGCVASTTLARAYPGQTQFILSNSPCFYSQFAVKQNAQNIQGPWTFDAYPQASSTLTNATTSVQFITLAQAQGLVNQGAATSTESIAGIVRLGTALQAASSTYLGVDIPLVLQTKNATSSPSVTCGLCVVVTGNAGKIAQAFLDLTQSFNWSGLHTFGAGFISQASSTVTSFNIASSTIFWNGKYVQPTFGGNGSDGALSITSGTTTVNLGNVSYYEKSYTSISISSTGHLAFSNPASGGTMIVLKSQGAVTLTCSPAPCIDVSSLGAAGATSVGNSGTGASATINNLFYIITNTPAQGSSSGAVGAVGPAATTTVPTSIPATSTLMKYGDIAWVGGGGGGGYGGNGANSSTGGAGGNGGGGLLVEVGGAFNFTTSGGIYAVGGSNTNASNGDGSCGTSAGGGGGGGGGWIHILYNTLTANTGSINVNGGTGGRLPASGGCFPGTYYGGGGGASGGVAGGAATSGAAANAKVGGDGATGASRIEKNNDYF